MIDTVFLLKIPVVESSTRNMLKSLTVAVAKHTLVLDLLLLDIHLNLFLDQGRGNSCFGLRSHWGGGTKPLLSLTTAPTPKCDAYPHFGLVPS